MLERWRALTGRIPVHDLIDRIFHEAEIAPRYAAAFPPALLPRVRASLTRFIELALEIDNGRYPSLPRFLDQLNRLRQSEQDQPDEHTPEEADNDRVRLMTIHGAKGLEAPVIFLADTATVKKAGHAYTALVDWPGDRDRPAHFLLAGTTAKLDTVSRNLLERQAQEALREDANLLYVAMTRARQYLYISGSQPDRGGDASWYQLVSNALADWDNTARGGCFRETGQHATPQPYAPVHQESITIDPRLSGIIPVSRTQRQIAPSRTAPGIMTETVTESGDADGRERGTAIHLMLQTLTTQALPASDTLPLTMASTIGREPDDPEAQGWWQEAIHTCHHPACAFLFEPSRFDQAFNEVPVQYLEGDVLVYGIIDRLVLSENNAYVIDYKTHRSANAATVPALAMHYREQLHLYARGIARVWPDMEVRPYLLFTACQELVAMNDPASA
jgi:ATP-dependent helicase/nuclease subunit A